VFYPISVLPVWMQYVAHALPPSYVFEGMRNVVAHRAVSIGALGWGAGLAAVSVLVSGCVFTAVYRHAVRTGLVARYSAETVS
jgi:ABC-2 type transport system permease protein